jgi:hypothetical protein
VKRPINAGARWILDYDLLQEPPEKVEGRPGEEVTGKVHEAKQSEKNYPCLPVGKPRQLLPKKNRLQRGLKIM